MFPPAQGSIMSIHKDDRTPSAIRSSVSGWLFGVNELPASQPFAERDKYTPLLTQVTLSKTTTKTKDGPRTPIALARHSVQTPTSNTPRQ